MTQPSMTKESQALVSSLAAQRDHVLGILEGLSEEDLQRPILPSRWTCAGLVHHLAIDVERFWFRAVVAGEPMPDDEPDNAWQVPADLTATAVLDAYRREVELADAIIAAKGYGQEAKHALIRRVRANLSYLLRHRSAVEKTGNRLTAKWRLSAQEKLL